VSSFTTLLMCNYSGECATSVAGPTIGERHPGEWALVAGPVRTAPDPHRHRARAVAGCRAGMVDGGPRDVVDASRAARACSPNPRTHSGRPGGPGRRCRRRPARRARAVPLQPGDKGHRRYLISGCGRVCDPCWTVGRSTNRAERPNMCRAERSARPARSDGVRTRSARRDAADAGGAAAVLSDYSLGYVLLALTAATAGALTATVVRRRVEERSAGR
jgi:hypothetical protein